jgi:hypothetical protein
MKNLRIITGMARFVLGTCCIQVRLITASVNLLNVPGVCILLVCAICPSDFTLIIMVEDLLQDFL